MSKSAFAAVNTLPKRSEESNLDPRATRYGFLPIWKKPVAASAFAVWEIPANQIFPFRPFLGEIGQDPNGNELYRHERMPEAQIVDMQTISKFFVELPALARLGNEDRARAVAEVLYNPVTCDKYPVELENACASCWLKDVLTTMRERIGSAFADDKELFKAATESAEVLRAALSNAIEEARRELDVAIRDIDDPKSGKLMFFDYDYLNVYHTHNERPQYKTSTSSTNQISQLADVLAGMAKQSKSVDNADLAAVIAAEVAKATESLREELAQYKKTEPTVEVAELDEAEAKRLAIAEKLKAKKIN